MITEPDLAYRIANKICSPHNQNATMIFVGSTGSGKSIAAISLAREVAKIVAIKKGGESGDYFDLERNVSVIDVMKFFDVLDGVKRYSTVIFDDAGIGWNARKFQDVVNITLNNITQVYRTLNLFTILTTPNFFFIDKVGRSLVDWICEMEGTVRGSDVSKGRVFEIKTKQRLGSHGKVHYIYPRNELVKTKSVYVLFNKPPEDICERYEGYRKQGADEYAQQSIEELKRLKGLGDEVRVKSDKFENFQEAQRLHDEEGLPITKACARAKIDRGIYYKWRDQCLGS